ncbi:MAG: STAS domain-containing protein [Janthinobacterium lividum]
MRKLITQSGGQRGCLGLSLRGNCISDADAALLAQAIGQLLTTYSSQIWVDCQGLHELSKTGQRALLQADRSARAVGTTLNWCGLPASLLAQLAELALPPALVLLPADAYQGPGFLRAAAAHSVATA